MADKPTNESHWKKVARLLGDDISSTAGTAKDIVGRGVVAPIMGLPVDMFNLGARRPEHKGSSEFFGEQMEDAGIVSPDRNPNLELLASLLNPASFAAKVAAVPALAATFAGKGAKGADLSKLFKAEEMLKKGGSDRDAYAQTGWTHGFADKKPRFEIDDSGLELQTKQKWGDSAPASEIINHPKLYENYPDIGNINTDISFGFSPSGRFSKKENSIKAYGKDLSSQRNAVVHELDHVIQDKEGFASGGSHINDGDDYPFLAGEASSRLAQLRRDMTAAERAKSYPPDMFDVPVEDQIVRFDVSKKKPTKWQY